MRCSCTAVWKRQWDGEVEMPDGVIDMRLT